jgi:hypothetical protein
MKKFRLKPITAALLLTLAGSTAAQSQWWWERFDVTGKVNQAVPATGALPSLIANPTGDNVRLNKSTSTQPALVVLGSAAAGVTTPVTTDLQISVENAQAQLPVEGPTPNFQVTVRNTGTAPANASVSFVTAVTGAASIALNPASCVAASEGAACGLSGTPEIASVSLPAGGYAVIAVPVTIGNGLGNVSVTVTVVGAPGIVDSNTANNIATLTRQVVQGTADVQLTVSDKTSSIFLDTDLEYSIILDNAGPSNATVQLSSTITTSGATRYTVQSLTAVGSDGASGSTATGIFVLPADSSVAINLKVRPTTGEGTIRLATAATITSANVVDPLPLNNSVVDTNTVKLPPVLPDGVPVGTKPFVGDLGGAGAYDVIFGDGSFFAISNNPAYNLVSVDGVYWYPVPRPFPVSTQVPMYADGMLIETMSDPVLGYKYAVSTDNGQTWTTGNLPAGTYLAQTAAEGRFVAIAISGNASTTGPLSDTILFTKDGFRWEENDMPYASRWCDVVNNGKEFVAVSLSDTRAAYSQQGQIWRPTTLPGTTGTTYCAITAGAGKFVAMSKKGGWVGTSMTGKSWQGARIMDVPWSAVAYGNGKFAAIAEGHNVLAQSVDGLNWSYSYPLTGNRTWRSLAFGNGVFVGVAMDSSTPIVFK